MSRDRAGVFADAATLGAPRAVQVADRWHFLETWGDVAERVLYEPSLPPIRVEQTEPRAKRPLETKPKKDRETRKDAERRQRDSGGKPSMTRNPRPLCKDKVHPGSG